MKASDNGRYKMGNATSIGENIPLQPSDIIISSLDPVLGVQGSVSNREFCQIVRLYANGTVLARVLGTDAPRLMKVSSIMVNLSFVGAKEKAYTELRRLREAWRPGKRVEVFSRSLNRWCVGYICKCIDLRSDARIAHGDLWFQLVYYDSENAKLCYKQVKFDKKDYLSEERRFKGSNLWEQFLDALSAEKESRLPRELHELLSKSSPRRSPSPQSSESTTDIGEDGLKKDFEFEEKVTRSVFRRKREPNVPLFHRAPSIDELPEDDILPTPTDAVHDKLLATPAMGDTDLPRFHRQSSIDEEPREFEKNLEKKQSFEEKSSHVPTFTSEIAV